MVDLATVTMLLLVSGVAPLFLGFLPSASKPAGVRRKLFAGVALGFLMLFFIDLMDDSARLGIDLGLAGGWTQLALLGSFGLGLLGLVVVEKFVAGRGYASSPPAFMAYLAALGMALHSFAEGIVVGYNFGLGIEVEELSNILQGISFSSHKALEGFVISVFLPNGRRLRIALLSGTVAGLPILIGAAAGLTGIPGIVSTFLFAMGAGAVAYLIVRLILVAFEAGYDRRVFMAMLFGMILAYLAGLLHTARL